MGRKIIAVVLAVVLAFSLCVPAYATASPSPSPSASPAGGGGHSDGGGTGTRWTWIERFNAGLSDFWTNITSAADPESAYQSALVPSGQDSSGIFLSLYSVCSDGSIIYRVHGLPVTFTNDSVILSGSYNSNYCDISYDCYGKGQFLLIYDWPSLSSIVAPASGSWSRGFFVACTCYVDGDLSRITITETSSVSDECNYLTPVSGFYYYFSSFNRTLGASFSFSGQSPYIMSWSGSSSGSLYAFPVLRCVPTDVYVPFVPSFGSVTGDVFITNDDGTTNVYKDCKFVDETNNLFFLPSTNTWVPYTGFTYDYVNRSYNFTYESGNTTITYGDEYITESVTDNSVTNIYNYYYSVDSGGSGGDGTVPASGWDWLKNLFGDGFSGLLSGLGSAIKKILESLADLISRFITAIGRFFAQLVDAFMVVVNWLAGILESIFSTVTDGFASFFSFIWQDAYTGFSSA